MATGGPDPDVPRVALPFQRVRERGFAKPVMKARHEHRVRGGEVRGVARHLRTDDVGREVRCLRKDGRRGFRLFFRRGRHFLGGSGGRRRCGRCRRGPRIRCLRNDRGSGFEAQEVLLRRT